jgi:superfamily II DNA or RNA helicase
MSDYAAFLTTKRHVAPSVGIDVPPERLHPALFDFQRSVVGWALRKGRAALFLDTGLGKTLCQLAWAEHAAERTLILAPLAVARQTVLEGARFDVPVTYARSQAEADERAPTGIAITNYEMLGHFDLSRFGAIVLDESSILANFSGVTKKALVAAARVVPMRLCCTATPAPNDIVELTNHADFLSIMNPREMTTTFFISKGSDQKDGKFRLKSHARAHFFRWLASWAMSVKRPSDIGFEDGAFSLPPLEILPATVETDYVPEGQLFATGLHGVTDRAAVRRGTLADRVARTLEIVRAEPDEPWLIWCGLNDEADAVAAGIEDAVQVRGSDTPERKADTLQAFAEGRIRVLVTKPSIAGFGLNFQRCARMAFVGLGDSYQTYYQSIRRCWRFGQARPVRAWIVLSDLETAIHENVLRKERESAELSRELIANVAAFERREVAGDDAERDPYEPTMPMTLPSWLRTVAWWETRCW